MAAWCPPALAYIGFPDGEAAELSALRTRNFM
jgi:hypothetical protein